MNKPWKEKPRLGKFSCDILFCQKEERGRGKRLMEGEERRRRKGGEEEISNRKRL